jgi:hypothetical protein
MAIGAAERTDLGLAFGPIGIIGTLILAIWFRKATRIVRKSASDASTAETGQAVTARIIRTARLILTAARNAIRFRTAQAFIAFIIRPAKSIFFAKLAGLGTIIPCRIIRVDTTGTEFAFRILVRATLQTLFPTFLRHDYFILPIIFFITIERTSTHR